MHAIAEEVVVFMKHTEGPSIGMVPLSTVHGLNVLRLVDVHNGAAQHHFLTDDGSVHLMQVNQLLLKQQTVKRT